MVRNFPRLSRGKDGEERLVYAALAVTTHPTIKLSGTPLPGKKPKVTPLCQQLQPRQNTQPTPLRITAHTIRHPPPQHAPHVATENDSPLHSTHTSTTPSATPASPPYHDPPHTSQDDNNRHGTLTPQVEPPRCNILAAIATTLTNGYKTTPRVIPTPQATMSNAVTTPMLTDTSLDSVPEAPPRESTLRTSTATRVALSSGPAASTAEARKNKNKRKQPTQPEESTQGVASGSDLLPPSGSVTPALPPPSGPTVPLPTPASPSTDLAREALQFTNAALANEDIMGFALNMDGPPPSLRCDTGHNGFR
ncbi:hypothetical protein EDB85DRAFT_1890901 [Lactarius pseudohatsudake]|nr:hypothetical protein EDB85DRAFT_1890901 [Lactarius pseudohatsudake]